MEERTFARLRDYVEPAHPGMVRLHEDLRTLYKHIRERCQEGIDAAFDQVSSQIGFVVATTVPFVYELKERSGSVAGGVIIEGRSFQGTLFERELGKALAPIQAEPVPGLQPGTYRFFAIWFEALKLKLRTDWVEPAHVLRRRYDPARLRAGRAAVATQAEPIWESHEPAHWFDPQAAIAADEAVQISVIDEVYSELRLVDRLVAHRAHPRSVVPADVKEPAHSMRPGDLIDTGATAILSELAAVLRRHGF